MRGRTVYLLVTPARVRAYSSWDKRQAVIDRAMHWRSELATDTKCPRIHWPVGWELLNVEVR